MTKLEINLSMVDRMRKAAVFLQTVSEAEAIDIDITPYQSNVLICGDLYAIMPEGCEMRKEPYDRDYDQTFFYLNGVKYFTLTEIQAKEDEDESDNL